MEIWKDAVGYEGLYLVSNMGRIKSLNYNRTGKHQILKQTTENKGYKVIALRTKKGVYKTIQVQRQNEKQVFHYHTLEKYVEVKKNQVVVINGNAPLIGLLIGLQMRCRISI